MKTLAIITLALSTLAVCPYIAVGVAREVAWMAGVPLDPSAGATAGLLGLAVGVIAAAMVIFRGFDMV